VAPGWLASLSGTTCQEAVQHRNELAGVDGLAQPTQARVSVKCVHGSVRVARNHNGLECRSAKLSHSSDNLFARFLIGQVVVGNEQVELREGTGSLDGFGQCGAA
jgi:hypothetical protein